ncbi:MAG: COX15/CtaA family protein, partial [Chloroflexota bacterium]
RRSDAAIAAHHLLVLFLLQATLGIATLLLAVPLPLGAAHQGGAVLLLAAALWTAHASSTSSPSATNVAAAMR